MMDRRGNVALIYAGILPAIAMIIAFCVDLSYTHGEKRRLQTALDNAVLNVALMDVNRQTVKGEVENQLRQQQDNLSYSVSEADLQGEQIVATAEVAVPSFFSNVTGITETKVRARSVAQWGGGTPLEIVLVVDNSPSMYWNGGAKALRAAVRDLVTTFETRLGPNQQDVLIGLVPYAVTTNVAGDQFDKSWMDTAATSPWHGNQFDESKGSVNVFELYDRMPNADWGGCVELRANGEYMNDNSPIGASKTGDESARKFVPWMVPDDPDHWTDDQSYSPVQARNFYRAQYLADQPQAECNTNGLPIDLEVGTPLGAGDKNNGEGNDTGKINWDCKNEKHDHHPSNFTAAERQADPNNPDLLGDTACRVADVVYDVTDLDIVRNADKYDGKNLVVPDSRLFKRGPNSGCPLQPIIPLQYDLSRVRTAVDKLENPWGWGTNHLVGFLWGERVLSPQVPYTGGVEWKDPSRKKILVFLTDGQTMIWNDAQTPNESYYSAFGFQTEDRFEDKMTDEQMNAMAYRQSKKVCERMKENDVDIYTVVFKETDKQTHDMAKSCANSARKFFMTRSSRDMKEAFEEIAENLKKQALHLSE